MMAKIASSSFLLQESHTIHSNMAIVHITGVSGSGKSTLARQLREQNLPQTQIYDLDDVDDNHAMTLINRGTMQARFWTNKESLNNEWMRQQIDLVRSGAIRVLVLIGLSMSVKGATHKFWLRADPIEAFTRQQLRDLRLLQTHSAQIHHHLERAQHGTASEFFISNIRLLYQFHVREPVGQIVEANVIRTRYEQLRQKMIARGYTQQTAERILRVVGALSQSNNVK